MNLLEPYPSITVGGVKHLTGPSSPLVLKILGLLPFLTFGLTKGGAITGVIAILGVFTNLAVARTPYPTAAKAGLMVLVLVATAGVVLIVAGALAPIG